jgi:predicted Zn-dependent peptidase
MNLARRCLLLSAVLALAPIAHAADKPQIDVQEVTLGNGMRFLLFERDDSPTIAAGWVAHVGSVNERPGITGISHLFEHMMFKGTKVIGTKNIDADLKIIEEQEKIRAEMRAELTRMREQLRKGEIDDVAKPENQSPRYRELDKRFDELVKQQRENIIKDHMDQLYTRNGGEALNAGTSEDWTIYFVRLPKNRLELWSWLESDRLLNPVFREFYSERDVVFEERRMRTESTPLGKYDEQFNAVFWDAHPYSWPVVGWASDIPAITKAQADEYFSLFYAPQNLTGVLVGDFKAADVKPVLERYFGRIPRGKSDPPEMVTEEPKQLGEKRFFASAETSPTVRIWWHAVPFVHKDAAPLDLLSDVLSGRTGRLYKGLVVGREVANEASASIDPRKYSGLFSLEAVVKDGKAPADVEKGVDEEIARLQNELVPADELQKVKNQAKANAYRRLSSPFSIAIQLLIYDGLGDWRYINNSAEKLDAVTAADLQRVAKTYLVKENRAVGIFTRKEASGPPQRSPGDREQVGSPGFTPGVPDDPEIAALPAETRDMARQQLAAIEAEKDPAKLKELLDGMQAQVAQVPEAMMPAFKLIQKRAQDRLAALEGGKK